MCFAHKISEDHNKNTKANTASADKERLSLYSGSRNLSGLVLENQRRLLFTTEKRVAKSGVKVLAKVNVFVFRNHGQAQDQTFTKQKHQVNTTVRSICCTRGVEGLKQTELSPQEPPSLTTLQGERLWEVFLSGNQFLILVRQEQPSETEEPSATRALSCSSEGGSLTQSRDPNSRGRMSQLFVEQMEHQ